MKKIIISSLIICAFINQNVKAQQINKSTIGKETETDSVDKDVKDAVHIYGVGGTDALNLEKITAAGGLTVGVDLFEEKCVKDSDRVYGLKGLISYNLSGNVAKKESVDSVSLNTIFFPDIGTSAFFASGDFYRQFTSKFYGLFTLEGSFQKRNIEKDSVVYGLNVTNVSFGPRFRWIHKNPKKESEAALTISFLFNHTEVLRESKRSFNEIFDDTEPTKATPPRIFNGFNAIAALEINRTTLYFRTYTDFDSNGDLTFTVGIKAFADIFSF